MILSAAAAFVGASCPGVDPHVASFARPVSPQHDVSTACASASAQNVDLCRLGEALFVDKTLSADSSVSCSSCHDPSRDFRDGRARPLLRGRHLKTPRTPSLLDVGRTEGPFFWNGRAPTLEGQIFWPLYSPDELGATRATLAPHGGASSVSRALTVYLETLRSPSAPFDAYASGVCDALSASEVAGMRLVLSDKNCTACHQGPELRGARVHALRYERLPHYAFLGSESSYSADFELAAASGQPHGRGATLGSLPQTLRNLPRRGSPWGRYGSHRNLATFLQMHVNQPEDPALRSKFSRSETAHSISFLFIGLRSR